MTFLSVVMVLSCLPTALIDFALPNWRGDANIQIEDAYKWTYQATRGGEHAAPDADVAGRWLMNEWETLGPAGKDEPVWEPLCPGGEIGRFNLRPFRARGGKQDDLVLAFVASSAEYKSEPSTFVDAWAELGRRLKKKAAGNLTYKEWTRLDDEMKGKGYPAVHHSAAYNKAVAPAYRVLTKAQAEKMGF